MQVASNVSLGAVAASVSVIIIWVLGVYGITVPPEVSGAIATLSYAIVAHGMDVYTGGNKDAH